MNAQQEFGRPPQAAHLSSETLDLLSLAALEASATGAARAHLEACEDCRGRYAELEADTRKFNQYVLPRTLPNIEARTRQVPFWERVKQKWTLALPAVGLVATVVLLVVVVPPAQQADGPYYGIKGTGARLDVIALRGDRQLPVGNDTSLLPGDRIRFLVEPAGASFVIVASKDGQGNVTVYYPYDGASSARVGEGLQELPGAIELDAVVGRERVVAVFSDAPLDADAVRQALAEDEPLQKLPGVREVVTKELVKDAP